MLIENNYKCYIDIKKETNNLRKKILKTRVFWDGWSSWQYDIFKSFD